MSEASWVTASIPPPPLPPLQDLQASDSSVWLRRGAILVFLAALFLPGLYYANDRYWLPLFTRYMALGLFAISVDLVWGYTGLPSLGQGLYFGLGAVARGVAVDLHKRSRGAAQPLAVAPGHPRP